MRGQNFGPALYWPTLVVLLPIGAAAADPLPSWNDGQAKSAVLSFVGQVTTDGRRDFVPPADRIAVFDNDGTLWCEQPFYFQGLFAFDRIRVLAPQPPDWNDKEPFKSVLAQDMRMPSSASTAWHSPR